MKKKKILVCGAGGFIGRNIYEALSIRKELEVFGTYNTRKFSTDSNLIKADLTKKEDVKKVLKGVDVLIQAAATTSGSKDIVEKPYLHVTDNAVMNSLLFQEANNCYVSKVIFFSCTVMYPQLNRRVKENDLDLNANLNDKYFGVGWTKIYIEKLSEFYSRLGRTKYIIIRHSNIYGPHDKFDLAKSHVFGATMTKIANAKEGKIIVWGEGKEKRDLLYVSDLVDFVEKAIFQIDDNFAIYNVGLGNAVSVAELVAKMIKISGKKIKIVFDKTKPNIKTSIVLNISKAKKKFGWKPKINLEEGIKKTFLWYQKNVKN